MNYLLGSQTMADIAIFNNTILCVIFKETQFNVSTKTIEGMRENLFIILVEVVLIMFGRL